LNPDALIPPQKINPALSAGFCRAILWAMALHPKDRPPSVTVWQAAIAGDAPVPHSAAEISVPDVPLADRLRQNAPLIAIAAVLLVWALWLTFGG